MLTDRELRQLRAVRIEGSIYLVAAYFSLILNRNVTVEEAQDAIPRLMRLND